MSDLSVATTGEPDLAGDLAGDDPTSWADVLLAECRALDPSFPDPPVAPTDVAARLQAINCEALRRGRAALCLSGGGIRSASFALGVIEGLARQGILGRFDYLSTVSGGGFAGGWLSGWLHQAGPGGADTVLNQLRGDRLPDGAVEPEPVARMRASSRYMSPDMGLLSADSWTLVATSAHNMFLNWMVRLPLVAAALLLPHDYLVLIPALYRPVQKAVTLCVDGATVVLLVSGALTAFGIGFVVLNVPSGGNRGGNQRAFLAWSLTPLCAGVVGLTLFWSMADFGIVFWPTVALGALAGGVTWTVVGLFSRTCRWRPRTSAGAVLSGAVAAAGLFGLGELFPDEMTCGRLFATTAVPLVFAVLTVATFVYIGVASADVGDGDLEWWSRLGSWLFIVAVGWLLVTGLVYYGPVAVRWLRQVIDAVPGMHSDNHATGAIGIGIATYALGAIATYAARALTSEKPGESSPLKRIAVAIAAPAFAVLLLASIAWMNEALLANLYQRMALAATDIDSCEANYLRQAVILGLAFLTFGLVMGRVVPVNKFSLHGMYRQRLIRGFLGASRIAEERHPNPFTGFDPDDDIQMCQLASVGRPMLVVNMTLNTVGEASRGRLHRKAESFTASPLFVGSPSLGYRPAAEYASNAELERRGLSLGTAMTISGAAASPNMGSHSSPALTFLLTLFNARLGAWLGNPGRGGEHSWRLSEPRQGVAALLRELLGRTRSSSQYVYLSDGGHYENLGLREMVLRRNRYILVSDAGCDPEYTLEDLAIAIRQVRIDLGIPIVFEHGCGIDREHQGRGNPHCAVGRIQYSAIDGPEAEDGTLLYLKATLSGDEPIDVLNYGIAHPAFPHESTANQWFGESQFESYRMLGLHSVMQMADGGHDGIAGFFDGAQRQSADRARGVPTPPQEPSQSAPHPRAQRTPAG